ncbi:MAG: ABC transporter permease [Bdellovibrionales bacterium]|nr:ABC transporter permease [Bdellovibrionales bacterium]
MTKQNFLPFLMLYYKELRRFNKVFIQTVLTPLITSSLYLLIFGISLGKNINLLNNIPYLAFIIPGLVMMGVLNNAYQNSSTSIISGKFSGDLQDLRVTPLSNHQIIWALALGGLTRGLLVGTITFFVGQIFYFVNYGSMIQVQNYLILFVFMIIGGLSFAMFGLSVAFWAKTFDQLSAVGSFILTPLIYLGGVFFSLENLHPFWQGLSKFNPLLYFINGVRYGILGQTDVTLWLALGVSFASLTVIYIIAWHSLKKSNFTRW